MKYLKLAILGVALVSAATPAVAQFGGSDSDQFIDAVQKRDGDKTTELLGKHPTIINSRDGKGDTALIIAIKRGDADFTGFLLNKGADPNLPDAKGDTPLIATARMDLEEAAEWLIGLGAKVDAANKMGETALIVAVQQHESDLVRLLLKQGADPDKSDAAAGYSARDYAKRDSRARDILKLIEDKKPQTSAAR